MIDDTRPRPHPPTLPDDWPADDKIGEATTICAVCFRDIRRAFNAQRAQRRNLAEEDVYDDPSYWYWQHIRRPEEEPASGPLA